MYPSAPPPSLAAAAPRLASEATSRDAQLVYLEISVPREMQDAVVRHHANLINLSDTLRDTGMSDTVIADHVDKAMSSYRKALIASLACRKIR